MVEETRELGKESRCAAFRRALVVLSAILGSATCAVAQPSFSVSVRRLPPAALQLGWPTRLGQVYEVQRLSRFAEAWMTMVTPDLPAIAMASSVSLEVAAADASGFFQVLERASPYDPVWQGVAPLRALTFNYDDQASEQQNGAALFDAMLALTPGDRLEIGPGTYSIQRFARLDVQGTAEAPIWIVAAAGARVIITRPDASQNVVNVGVDRPTRYVCLRGLEFVGGSHGVRLYDCAEVWMDRCRIRDTGDVGLSANARDTSRLHITRNEIWNTGGTGEGMYLGGNNASVIMSESVIALNYVHDTDNGTSQGDGIEVKQGSWGNLIAANVVRDANYPCILVYGTGGRPMNIVENNVCYRSHDNTMQIQGECIVRNNLVMGGAGSAFASQPHQGAPTRMKVVHNTFINTSHAARISSWGDGTEMVFANNACYSRSGAALNAVNGAAGVTFSGNVAYGSVNAGGSGFTAGAGMADFRGASWDASALDARPSPGSPLLGAGGAAHATTVDLEFLGRTAPHTAGCYR